MSYFLRMIYFLVNREILINRQKNVENFAIVACIYDQCLCTCACSTGSRKISLKVIFENFMRVLLFHSTHLSNIPQFWKRSIMSINTQPSFWNRLNFTETQELPLDWPKRAGSLTKNIQCLNVKLKKLKEVKSQKFSLIQVFTEKEDKHKFYELTFWS